LFAFTFSHFLSLLAFTFSHFLSHLAFTFSNFLNFLSHLHSLSFTGEKFPLISHHPNLLL
jgi:hypothetical protein